MKKFIKLLLVYFFVLFFVANIFKGGIILPLDWIYVVATLVILALTVMIAEPFLKFLTIRTNFLTLFIMSALLLIGMLFLLRIFMTGFYINAYTFKGMELGSIQIDQFVISPIATIAFSGSTAALICSIYRAVDGV